MLKKINRLSKDKEFAYVKENGRMVRTPLFGLLYVITNNQDPNNSASSADEQTNSNDKIINDQNKKVGFIVSKKISKKAVDRNRIRRLLAEAIRSNLDKLPEGFRGIFLATKQMMDRKYEEVEKTVTQIISSSVTQKDRTNERNNIKTIGHI